MAVAPFEGHTFVAFVDICGFKAMMSEGQRGPLALDALYSAGFDVLREHRNNANAVDGFFVSDCGVLFVRNENADNLSRLWSLCFIVKEIHRRTFKEAVQLTSSIAWGRFSYHERIEFPGIDKSPIYGNAYIAAFTDNEGSPKLYPNECRIIRRGLPVEVIDVLHRRREPLWNQVRETPDHFYYEWMRE
ncbi:MAG: hypothetical protein ACXWID_04360 [Pyrinomonadaceae bacterium]